jgi:hypothetical protein
MPHPPPAASFHPEASHSPPFNVFTLTKRSSAFCEREDLLARSCKPCKWRDDQWGGRRPRAGLREGEVRTHFWRDNTEGGPRKLATEKISAVDDERRFRPAFRGRLRTGFSVAPSFPFKRSRLKAACAGLSGFLSNTHFGIRDPPGLRSGHQCTPLQNQMVICVLPARNSPAHSRRPCK